MHYQNVLLAKDLSFIKFLDSIVCQLHKSFVMNLAEVKMNIYVDADACPRTIREILIRAAIRVNLPIIFVANQSINLQQAKNVSMLIVPQGPDIADDKIAELVTDGDLVISEDIPLADRVIEKGGTVISTRGSLYTKENIKQRLATRDLLNDLRSAGIETGGVPMFSPKDARTFANQLDRFLAKACIF